LELTDICKNGNNLQGKVSVENGEGSQRIIYIVCDFLSLFNLNIIIAIKIEKTTLQHSLRFN